MGELPSGYNRRPHDARVQVGANVGRPQVAYKETITKTVEAEASLSANPEDAVSMVTLKIIAGPNETGKGFEFENGYSWRYHPP